MAEAKKAAPKAKKVEKPKEEVKVETEVKDEVPTTAKAGKRSAKAVKEAEEKQAKEVRRAKVSDENAEVKPKHTQKPPRSRLERQGKRFREAAKLVDKNKEYTLSEAVELAIKTASTKFDSTLELHMRLNVDPKQSDQNIRDTVVLPAGTGKSVRVAVFGDASQVAAAKKAGADIAGEDDFLAKLDKEQLDFDVLIASPAVMARLGKYARLLGPKGLMPNPKSGTVTTDIAKAVSQAKAGRVEYRVDPTGIVHLGVGKVSFGKDKLLENVTAVVESIRANKPASVKANFIASVFISTSMGPSIKVTL